MVFSSIPSYLDPANWQQQPNHQQTGSNPPQLPSPPRPLSQPHVGPGGIGSIRPGSMSDRARLANVPMPDPALKCPRCESTNTKFCYFNNYNLTQPRHFCKTCRRYWTRGGALRSVPVGGGCRRNKRTTKSNSSNNSPSASNIDSNSTVSSTTIGPGNMLGLMTSPPPLRFLSPLGQLSLDHHHYGGITSLNNYNGGISTGGEAGTTTGETMNFQLGTNFLGNGIEPWRIQQSTQQFPFLGGMDLSLSSSLGQFSQLQGCNNVEMVSQNNDQWSIGADAANWTDFSSFSSSSTSNPQ